ncbi:serine hydrolase domain-containing protein [Oceanobacillus halophilus]|uniref:Class C beta-lactamase-related serine hydrolase n=1 Tax=Oceanobacillus halophilus TaxID=930130 RepID=A0A495A186_9BACI|nr:serine hydrolase [Oceanobacillus halophilus]RKQ33201.1 class C beta-lactamase-related serine hydrolase [Oceanobacillus halophilus]
MTDLLTQSIHSKMKDIDFSGVAHVKMGDEVLLETSRGFSNRAEEIKNTMDTRFGIASGCKIFTAVGIAKLVDEGKLSFEDKLIDCLDTPFPNFDEGITIHHLLTHSSGIPDYFDEDVMDDFEELWQERPMYTMTKLEDFLPMFINREMMFSPGDRFHYNNAGYILLGLVIEKMTGTVFTEYIEKELFPYLEMTESGYFSMDQLPKNTALGYIETEDGWKTNIYSLPIKGGPDGGAYITTRDMITFWEALFTNKILSEDTTKSLLTPHIREDEDTYYGYGIWIDKQDGEIFKYHVMGYDPGVSFHSAFYPNNGLKLVIPSNKSEGAYSILEKIEEHLFKGLQA